MTSASRATTTADDMTDAELDGLLPVAVRRVSRVYWTSVAVARKAAEILEHLGVRRVLDMGAGPGKFCVVAGARAPCIEFVGIEHRPRLVAIARSLAAEVGVVNVAFSVGDATRAAWTDFDAFYVFNSFAENDLAVDDRFDGTVELSRARHIAEVTRVARRLATAPVGTVLLTYHGLTGPIPRSYELLHAETAGAGWMRVWRKGDAASCGKYWLEEGAEVSAWAARPV